MTLPRTPSSASIAIVHSVEAEQALLGGLMLDSRDVEQVARSVVVNDFHRADHRILYAAILDLVVGQRVPDPVVVVDHLYQAGNLESAGGKEYIANIVQNSRGASNVLGYAEIIHGHSAARRAIQLGDDIAAVARQRGGRDAIRFALQSATAFLGDTDKTSTIEPLDLAPVSTWAAQPAPAPRDWIIEPPLGIAAGRVSSLIGDGGIGKTMVGLQIGLSTSLGRTLFGAKVNGGPVLGLFAEDEQDELNRRLRAVCAGEHVDLETVDNFVALSRDGVENLLCTFDRDVLVRTRLYDELDATVAAMRPRLVILDTIADIFGGDFINTSHVRQFVKTALGGLCKRYGCAVLLLGHPSQSAKNSGEGSGYSVQWNNAVRTRLYLRRPKSSDAEQAKDRRVISNMKTNVGPDGGEVHLRYADGYFALDDEPIEEGAGARAKPEATRLSFAVLTFIGKNDPAAVSRSAIIEHARSGGLLKADLTQDAAEKQVSRALKELLDGGHIRRAVAPRGHYRLSNGGDK